ncbi:MAG: molybdopterin-dependent oxidoreductase [Deltaproteobacteria bacterium]|nr:molybdopterin-dependent oxidoreductase [Deltaproteobacteria bacterium]
MGGIPGTTTRDNFSLQIKGEVEKPLGLSYQELLALEQVPLTCDVHCVTGWTLLDSRRKSATGNAAGTGGYGLG